MSEPKVGDRVKITNPDQEYWSDGGPDLAPAIKGQVGVISSVHTWSPWPYAVRLDDPVACGEGRRRHQHDFVALEREEFEIITEA